MPIVTHREANAWWDNLIAAGKAVDNDAKYPVLALAAALTQCCADAKDARPSRLYPEERSWGEVLGIRTGRIRTSTCSTTRRPSWHVRYQITTWKYYWAGHQ